MSGKALDQVLSSVGIKVQDLPGFLLSMVLVLAGVELVIANVPFLHRLDSQLTPTTAYLAHLALAFGLAMINYEIGDFWDGVIFDRLYSVRHPHTPGKSQPDPADCERDRKGLLLDRDGQTLGVLRAGKPLNDARTAALERLDPRPKTVHGVYERAKLAVTPAQLAEATSMNARSKFCRTLIFPSLAVGIGCIVWAVAALAVGRQVDDAALIGALTVALLVGMLLFVPNANQRVDHMRMLYESVPEQAIVPSQAVASQQG